jgi:hypothetical protein
MNKLITALILVATAAAAQAGPVEDAFIKMGFTQTNRGLNNTVYATFEKTWISIPVIDSFLI